MKIEIVQEKLSEDRQSSFWYEGLIAKVEKNGVLYELIATGEIRFIPKKDSKNSYRDYEAFNFAINEKWTDKELNTEIVDDGWIFSNWFEVIGSHNGFSDFVLGDVAFSYDEAIALLQSYADEDVFIDLTENDEEDEEFE